MTLAQLSCQKDDIEQLVEFCSPVVQQTFKAVSATSNCNNKQRKVKDSLLIYSLRDAICAKDPASELVGLELCIGLSDATIDSIAKHFKSIEAVDDLLKLGIPSIKQAQEILTLL